MCMYQTQCVIKKKKDYHLHYSAIKSPVYSLNEFVCYQKCEELKNNNNLNFY